MPACARGGGGSHRLRRPGREQLFARNRGIQSRVPHARCPMYSVVHAAGRSAVRLLVLNIRERVVPSGRASREAVETRLRVFNGPVVFAVH
jgi:hypothetical protein